MADSTLFGSSLFGKLASDVGLVLCDVGSRGGALEDFLPAAAFTDVVGFEPEAKECARLNEAAALPTRAWRNERHYQVALGESDARLELKVCQDPFYSSTLEPVKELPLDFGRSQEFQVVDRLMMDVRGLEGFCAANAIADLDFVKVDVQGSELAILKGGGRLVSHRLLGIRCEVEFAHLYEGQPLFSEMELHLRALGFYPADWLYQRHWRSDPRYEHAHFSRNAEIPYSRGRIIHSDALFLRDHRWILANDADPDPKLCKLALIALLYHHVDLTAAILPLIRSNAVVNSAPLTTWREELALVSRTLSRIAFREQRAEWMVKIRRFLRRK